MPSFTPLLYAILSMKDRLESTVKVPVEPSGGTNDAKTRDPLLAGVTVPVFIVVPDELDPEF